jgi:predicted nucleotidyltransferase
MDALLHIASSLLSDEFSVLLKKHLELGISFPAAREAALSEAGCDAALIKTPNNILAVEYCKAILSQGSSMQPMPILRHGNYHDNLPDPENPSATAVRSLMAGDAWRAYVPGEAAECFDGAPLHALAAGERAILMRLRTMTDREFEAVPYGSEGLWRKFMHASRKEATVEDILTSVKSKRYTRTRLDRMLMCAFLGITKEDLAQQVPYVRALAFNDRGREILKQAREHIAVLNIGQPSEDPYAVLEQRCDDLYGLFCTTVPEPPGMNAGYRVYYQS